MGYGATFGILGGGHGPLAPPLNPPMTPDAIVFTHKSYLDLRGRFAVEREEQGGEGRKEREVTAKNGREGNIGE